MLSIKARTTIEDVLHRAVDDSDFMDLLATDAAVALAGTELGVSEQALVGSLDSVALEESGIDIRPFRRFLTYPRMGGRVGGFIPEPSDN